MCNATSLIRRALLTALLALPVVSLPAAEQTPASPRGVYVMTEEGDSMNGAYARLALVTFSETGAVSGWEVVRTTTGTESNQFQGSFVLDTPDMGTLFLRYPVTDGEGNEQIREVPYKIALGLTGIEGLRENGGYHAAVTLAQATDPNHTGNFLVAEPNSANTSGRILMITLDPSGVARGVAVGIADKTTLAGSFNNGENGFHNLSLSVRSEDSEGNLIITTESYVAAFEKDSIAILRTDGGPVKLNHLIR